MKRFTETKKWDDAWFRRLPWRQKLLWLWLCDTCDAAGVFELDAEHASYFVGSKVTRADFTDILKSGRLTTVAGHPAYWRIVGFIPFQYRNLSTACRAHDPVYAALSKWQLKPDELMREKRSDPSSITPPNLEPAIPPPLAEGYGPAMEKDEGKDGDKVLGKVKEEEKEEEKEEGKEEGKEKEEIYTPLFMAFWQAYPRRDGKFAAFRAWEKAIAAGMPPLDQIISAVKRFMETDQWRKDDGAFIPHAATWLNQRRWEDYDGAPPPQSPAEEWAEVQRRRLAQQRGGYTSIEDARKAAQERAASEDGEPPPENPPSDNPQ